MMRYLFAVGCVVALACAGVAQEPKLPQPKVAAAPKAEAAKRLAEEVEAIEAHLQTKKAYVQAAVVALNAAERGLDRVSKLAGSGVATRESIDDAKLGVDAAKAQVLIREAEANEVAVKLKHAKRRADEPAKADAGTLGPELRDIVIKQLTTAATDIVRQRLVQELTKPAKP